VTTATLENVRTRRARTATLRRQLLMSLLAPIVLVIFISSIVSYYFSFNFATLAYDYALFDSALDLSRHVRLRDGRVRLDLPSAALDMLESDKHDRIYHMVNDSKGGLIAGNVGLPLPPDEVSSGKPVYYDGNYRGNPVRIAALYAMIPNAPDHEPILVQVAETLNKRRILANEILLGMLLPELLLILVVGMIIWFGVERALRPLAALQKEIGSRSHRDLSPLPEQTAPDEVRALVRAMNDLLARLSEALSSQQRFIADAAHQLRTPLAGLKTQTELALRQDAPAEIHRTLLQLNTATGHTTHLVNQLLSLARAEPGNSRAQALQAIDLNELAREITSEWVPHALERNIDLGFDASPQAPCIEGDTLLLKEMLRNLLDNAIRYTPPGGQVTVRVTAQNNKAQLSVEDNGPGVPAVERERVFERFYRLLGTGAEGCGLGLAIVREIAASHNAETRLDPGANGSGTLASVIFPAIPGAAAN
jgi:two-component system, OmpR family, sensor histidine kinase TctE